MFRRIGRKVLLGTLAWLGDLVCGRTIRTQVEAEIFAREHQGPSPAEHTKIVRAYERQVARRAAGEFHGWPSRGGDA